MSENFEASFDEQLQAIQAEAEDIHADLAHLPAALSQPQGITPFCFDVPDPDLTAEDPASILAGLAWEPRSRERAATMMADYCDTQATEMSLLGGIADKQQEAAARILAVLVCAEESAINIFHHECNRLSPEETAYNHRALREIESEERVHNWLIHQARGHLPVPDDVPQIRRRTRRLFMRVASRDLGTHFARITGLDSGVCISLTALLSSGDVRKHTGFARLIKHIRRDEATHVKKSRDHAVALGFSEDSFHDAYDLTRAGMVGMLEPIAGSFEDMGVDPDRLFGRLLRFQGSRMPDSVELND
ncbi:hypothetical protein ATO7_00400 [Oceanococcus atlanticus]|uniref:Ferritin-like domain-containing protein n=1 Tax=Oceanococcus atlanticus TaxID=1317117 RepID=A0A1Y1SGG8_9GAMM|nr:hypothetical protein [Oceanococcus atlanticus]ORE88289.1 hypothetical protein ATO7_00400 [Oceanococcus atlanticus]